MREVPVRRVALLSAAGLLVALVPAAAAPSPPGQDANEIVSAHLTERHSALGKQRTAALTQVRHHAWMAYRLGRRRELGFFADTKLRPEAARAAAMAVVVLNRSLQEATKLEEELQRLQQERQRVRLRGAALAQGPEENLPAGKPSLVWPTKGSIISTPGLRPDPVTGVVYRDTGLQILARVDAAVISPGAATVRRVSPQPTGGYAVALKHADGLISILSGLRVVDVQEGEKVAAGAPLGRVGRTLDGAPVLRLAVWRAGQPVDPSTLRIWR